MRRFEATEALPPGSVFRTGPGGAPYVVLTSAAGPEVYVSVVDAAARGWLREVPERPSYSGTFEVEDPELFRRIFGL